MSDGPDPGTRNGERESEGDPKTVHEDDVGREKTDRPADDSGDDDDRMEQDRRGRRTQDGSEAVNGQDQGQGHGLVQGQGRGPLRPWDVPDYNRQVQLADRLSSPQGRSSSTAGAAAVNGSYVSGGSFDPSRSPYPVIQQSPLNPRRPRTAVADAGRMSSGRARDSNGLGPAQNRPVSSSYSAVSASSYSSSSTTRSGGKRTRMPPLYPNRANDRRVTEDELDVIVGRVTRPTVASRGGVDLQGKDFTYIRPPRLKTMPFVAGLDRRYLGLQPVESSQEMGQIVSRLTRLTTAYQAKFAPNRNVWLDTAPGAHLVAERRRRAQSAV